MFLLPEIQAIVPQLPDPLIKQEARICKILKYLDELVRKRSSLVQTPQEGRTLEK